MPAHSFSAIAAAIGRSVPPSDRPIVCVQGLGFVGAAMALAVADARDPRTGQPRFDVIGVELPTPDGRAKVDAVNVGDLPVRSADPKMSDAMSRARRTGNLIAVTNDEVYGLASVAVVDVHLDLLLDDGRPTVRYDGLITAVRMVSQRLPVGGLIIVETTVPPGTCDRVLGPEIDREAARRGLKCDELLLAHSYERVMPGSDYFDSIVNFWRVFSGRSQEAADACERFLSQVVNTEKYPLTRLPSTTASEMAKVLENSYRAATIAFMEEWGRFAEEINVDLMEVVNAIRKRPTHSNIRQPGFGVGGYCLTKDPLFADVAARDLFGLPPTVDFPFCHRAVATNRAMPIRCLDRLDRLLGGLRGKRLLLLGVSYRQDVADTRFSPSEDFLREAEARGASVQCHDPLVVHWPEVNRQLATALPHPHGADAVVFAVQHREYQEMDVLAWLGAHRPLVFDGNGVLTRTQRSFLHTAGIRVFSIGRGEEAPL
ncbi:MAG: nucleotide sugar dehydrogenase [Polyangiaceae bacterium]|nr:nucleotide sugar dehydrogenase [Polyangiaceae bacterium]